MNRTYKFRLYPSKKQTRVLEKTLEVCRMTYNDMLSKRIEHYKTTGKTLSCYDQQKYLTTQKTVHDGMKEVYAQVLQNVAVRVDLAFQGFFRRLKCASIKAGFPRFKKFNRYDSFTFTQNNGSFKIAGNKIYLSKIGHVKIKQHRELAGEMKTCVVSRDSVGKWFVCITCARVPKKLLDTTNKQVGIDLGLSEFATLSDNTKIDNPRFFKECQDRLAKAQRKLAKLKDKDVKSKEYRRQKKIVARIHSKIKNKRDNFVHQESRKVINTYDSICVEDLNINRMKEDGKYPTIAKSIADVAWGDFISKLDYKAEDAGRRVIKVNPAYTSQMCSRCGCRKKMLLSERHYKCDSCGFELNRDLNASRNILRLGLESVGVLSHFIEAQVL